MRASGLQKGAEHDSAKHGHHHYYKNGYTCGRFPRPEYDEGLSDTAMSSSEKRRVAVTDGEPRGMGDLEVVSSCGFTHVRCPAFSPCAVCGEPSWHMDSLVIAVDGACPGNGQGLVSQSSCGVYFGPDNPRNMAIRVPDTTEYPHTNQRAELIAAISGVRASMHFISHGGQVDCCVCPTPCTVNHVVIKSDSAYLVKGITSWVPKWRKNGWRTSKKGDVQNQDLWEELDGICRDIYDMTDTVIDFWHVRREQNVEADRLANLGLRQDIR